METIIKERYKQFVMETIVKRKERYIQFVMETIIKTKREIHTICDGSYY